jgi:hypothetical protein
LSREREWGDRAFASIGPISPLAGLVFFPFDCILAD